MRIPSPADRGHDLDANVAALVDVLNCLPGLRTLSSRDGHPPPRTIGQADEGHYRINFDIHPVDGGWESLQNLAYMVANMEDVTIKVNTSIRSVVWRWLHFVSAGGV